MTAALTMKSLVTTSSATLIDSSKAAYHASLSIDTSCLIAVALREAGYEVYMELLTRANTLHLSAVSRVELGIVSHNKRITRQVEALLTALNVNIEPFDSEQAAVALTAFTKYGKGRHPAALNFGDCCAYALAKSLNLPLLYKGNDFAQTDIAPALA